MFTYIVSLVFRPKGLQPERATYAYPGPEEPNAERCYIMAVGTVVGKGWDHSFGSSIQVLVVLE
jgi:hypothetical protein